jgi:hypothetical protein
MSEEHDDFIGIFENAVSREDCNRIIKDCDEFLQKTPSGSITAGAAQMPMLEFSRLDYSFNATVHLPQVARIIDDALHRCILQYASKYFLIKQLKASTKEVKIQKTPPRGGYHFWHCESFSEGTAVRALAWMIYLNDIPKGEGETEFIWQKLRVQPEAGKCLIWPTQFTHTHRGNPVYSTPKYIATGWYTYDG